MLGKNHQKKTVIVAEQTIAICTHSAIIWNCVLGGSCWAPEYHATNISTEKTNKSTTPATQKTNDAIVTNGAYMSRIVPCVLLKRDNGNVHRAAANINASKSRAARGSVCNVLLSAVQPSVVGIHLIPSAFHCSRHCLGCPRSVSFAIGEV